MSKSGKYLVSQILTVNEFQTRSRKKSLTGVLLKWWQNRHARNRYEQTTKMSAVISPTLFQIDGETLLSCNPACFDWLPLDSTGTLPLDQPATPADRYRLIRMYMVWYILICRQYYLQILAHY